MLPSLPLILYRSTHALTRGQRDPQPTRATAPTEVEREGRDAFGQIGEDTSETIERRPASVAIVLVRRPKLMRKDRERNAETTVVVAPTTELPIERGLAGLGFLAGHGGTTLAGTPAAAPLGGDLRPRWAGPGALHRVRLARSAGRTRSTPV
jgi:hypothetical protein